MAEYSHARVLVDRALRSGDEAVARQLVLILQLAPNEMIIEPAHAGSFVSLREENSGL
jgi:hypothetical protein